MASRTPSPTDGLEHPEDAGAASTAPEVAAAIRTMGWVALGLLLRFIRTEPSEEQDAVGEEPGPEEATDGAAKATDEGAASTGGTATGGSAQGGGKRVPRCVVVAPPIAPRGDEDVDRKLARLQPLCLGVRLVPCPEPHAFAAAAAETAPGMGGFLDWAAGELALRRLGGPDAWFQLPPVLLHGPPGMGKTHLARHIAEIARAPNKLVNLGGSSDARTLLGTSAGYSTAAPSLPAHVMATTRFANPVLILDEIDKLDLHSRNGSWADGLLAFLEPVSARRVFDEFALVEVDCSRITWIATANRLDRLPAPLRSRFHCFEVDRPIDPRPPALAMGGLVDELARDLGLDPPLARALAEADPSLARALAAAPSPRLAKGLLRAALGRAVRERTLQ